MQHPKYTVYILQIFFKGNIITESGRQKQKTAPLIN